MLLPFGCSMATNCNWPQSVHEMKLEEIRTKKSTKWWIQWWSWHAAPQWILISAFKMCVLHGELANSHKMRYFFWAEHLRASFFSFSVWFLSSYFFDLQLRCATGYITSGMIRCSVCILKNVQPKRRLPCLLAPNEFTSSAQRASLLWLLPNNIHSTQ